MVTQTRPTHFISGVFEVLHGSREAPRSREISSKGVRSFGAELSNAFRTTWEEDSHGQEPCRFPRLLAIDGSGSSLVQTKGTWILQTILQKSTYSTEKKKR